jgi:hypothetical protein
MVRMCAEFIGLLEGTDAICRQSNHVYASSCVFTTLKKIEKPAACEMRSVTRFLNARNMKPADIHRQLSVWPQHCGRFASWSYQNFMLCLMQILLVWFCSPKFFHHFVSSQSCAHPLLHKSSAFWSCYCSIIPMRFQFLHCFERFWIFIS